MHVGLCRITFRLPESHSIKGKRRIAQSVITRLHHRFNVSIAEVAENDIRRTLTLGIACVSNDPRHADEILASVINTVREMRLDLELVDLCTEIMPGL